MFGKCIISKNKNKQRNMHENVQKKLFDLNYNFPERISIREGLYIIIFFKYSN